ncbi:MAG: glycoside hydrolase family 2 TIM barrel-domain containing protein [Candidatus Diapherotrites archaeon]|nr:glycoside hydrolase family 2 TIM barrel-domain containing protein [Candidatus Diapherotrites archaeon]
MGIKLTSLAVFLFALFFIQAAFAINPVFYEPFDSIQSVKDKNGFFTLSNGQANVNPLYSTIESGVVGNALHMRTNEFVQYQLKDLDTLNQGTIELLFKRFDPSMQQGLVQIDSNFPTLWNTNKSYGIPYVMGFISSFNAFYLELYSGGQSSGGRVSSGVWHHMALTWNCGPNSTGVFRVYYDGMPGGANSWDKCDDVNFLKPFLLRVGQSYFYGVKESVIDEVKVFDYTKTGAEISQDYNSYSLQLITCTLNADCGKPNTWNTCYNGNAAKDYITPICTSPNTTDAACVTDNNYVTVQVCGTTTYGDWGANYCDGSAIKKTRIIHNKGCYGGACTASDTNETQTIKVCAVCSGGVCETEIKPQSTGSVKVSGRELLVDNGKYKIKSVGYAPVPIGNTPDQGYDITVHPELTARDFPLLRTMNANTIRTWGKVNSPAFLDAAWNNGNNPIRVMMGFWMSHRGDFSDPTVRTSILADFNNYVTAYKNHPAVLVWAIGNEENRFYANGNNARHALYFSLVNEMAKNAYLIEGSAYHPVMAVSLEMPDQMTTVGNSAGGADDANIPYIDIWGINHYPTYTFTNFFSMFESKTSKPLVITEYGIDALDNRVSSEYEQTQADWTVRLWREISASNVAIGGSLMEYSDEFWKAAGSYSAHDNGGYPTTSHPDGYSNEEWWGVMRVTNNGSNPDIMTPRKVYYALQQEFDKNKYILHLADMPFFQADLNNFSGAASAQMILNYIRNGAGQSDLTQQEIQDYAHQYNRAENSSLPELDADGMDAALGHFDPYDSIVSNNYDNYDSQVGGNPYQGYNYSVDVYDSSSPDALNNYLRDIAHWMAYPVTKEEWWKQGELVFEPNTPAALPIFGSYSRWVAVNGFAASANPTPNPKTDPWFTPQVTLYGFWITDPVLNGLGQHIYVTASDAGEIYFKPMQTNDSYNGKYLQIAEPPVKKDGDKIPFSDKQEKMISAGIKVAKPAADLENLNFIGVAGIKNLTKITKKKSWKDLVDSHLLSDSEAVSAFEGSKMSKAIKIQGQTSEQDYYLVAFKKGKLTSGAIMLDAGDGSFKQASWTLKPVNYLPVSKEIALSLAKKAAKQKQPSVVSKQASTAQFRITAEVLIAGNRSAQVIKECKSQKKIPAIIATSASNETQTLQLQLKKGTQSLRLSKQMSEGGPLTFEYQNDCCIGWNGSKCTIGSTDVRLKSIQANGKTIQIDKTLYSNSDTATIVLSEAANDSTSAVLSWEPNKYSKSPFDPYWVVKINRQTWIVTQAKEVLEIG